MRVIGSLFKLSDSLMIDLNGGNQINFVIGRIWRNLLEGVVIRSFLDKLNPGGNVVQEE